MLPASYLDNCANNILELYSKLDEYIVKDIAQRLIKYGGVTKSSEWQILRAQEIGLLYEDIIFQIAAITNASDSQVKTLFEDAGIEALHWDNEIYEAAGLTAIPIRQSPSALKVLLAGINKTASQLNNLTLTTALQAQQAYINASTIAEMQIESGAFSYSSAISNAIKQAIKDGTSVQYPSGHIDKLDVAVRRAVLTGVNQTCADISLSYANDLGCGLVETTAHHGARPEHLIWQGKVFSTNGKHSKYPPFSQTGYGTGNGLCGWNCRHSFYPFFEGLSASAYPKDKLLAYENQIVSFNSKDIPYYNATQKQRAYERDIRASKRELVAYEASIKKAATDELRNELQLSFDNASVKLKMQESRLKDFVKQTGLQKDSNRVQTFDFGRSTAQKAVWASKKNILTNAAGMPIIRVGQTKVHGIANSITQVENNKGGINRNFFNEKGDQILQISNNGHNHKKETAMGKNGEHAHNYILDEKGIPRHQPARELTEKEREDNRDLL